MSMKLQAQLVDDVSSRVEGLYMQHQDVIRLENQPLEMTFIVTQGFMEHESEKHDYLPCYHMIGHIKELKGNLPYHVSTLYFKDSDMEKLTKDIYYYPTPEELAHIIQVGKFYTKNFQIPKMLCENSYSLPVIVDLTIVPPSNEAAYEQNIYSDFNNLDDDEKTNLPLFYVGIVGTGVTRKNDRLLDYYGLDIDPQMDPFILTAESSGYVDPPLLAYMKEPAVQVEESKTDVHEYYITPEEEAQMLRSRQEQTKQAEAEAIKQVGLNAQEDFRTATPEDALIAKADRNIVRRQEKMFGGKTMSLDAKRRVEEQREAMRSAQNMGEAQPDAVRTDKAKQTPQQMADVKMDFNPEANEFLNPDTDNKTGRREDKRTEDILTQDAQDNKKLQGADVADARAQAKVDEAHTAEIARDNAIDQQQDMTEHADKERATPEQMAEFKLDLDTEKNSYVHPDEDEKQDTDDIEEKDRSEVEHMAGADVSDAEDQAKVDEAHTRDIARDTAAEQQRQHRQVPESMQELADKYNQGRSGSEDHPDFA